LIGRFELEPLKVQNLSITQDYTPSKSSTGRTLRAATGRIVAATSLTTSSDRNTRERKVRAAIRATENIVVLGIIGGGTGDISESDSRDSHTISRFAGRTAIEIILLDIDTVVGDSRDSDVLVNDVANLFS
jgi:hypothetical protein